MTRSRRWFALLLGCGPLALVLAACSVNPPSSAPSAPASGSASAQSSSAKPQANGLPAVPGYKVGEIPPVPLFTVPDIGVLTNSADRFKIDTTTKLRSVPGITVEPARCDESGMLMTNSGSTVLYGDGSGSTRSANGDGVTNYGDGSAHSAIDGVSITNYGDGSGNYEDGTVRIVVYGDGSGSFEGPDLKVTLYGDGSGDYEHGGVRIVNYGDGHATYEQGDVRITNYGDGSGNYESPTLTIVNYGEGKAFVNGTEVDAERLPQVAPVGSFPNVDAINPIQGCGTRITLQDGVLFDFGESTIRPDAASTLSALAEILKAGEVPAAQVDGHTDSVSDEVFNQRLSEARAKAVVDALVSQGVTTALEAHGYGESRPIAPNENPDGSDDPAGRQANRRVEIFIPAF